MNTEDPITISDNPANSRFEAHIGDFIAVAEYRLKGKTITFTHTEVPSALEGRGVAANLVKWALEFSRAQHYRVIPQCPFVSQYIQRHPQYSDLLAG